MRRREFLAFAGATIAAGCRPRRALAQAQSWPERTVKLILPYAPGGATDAIGRPWAEKLSQAFGQQFVIENRGGAERHDRHRGRGQVGARRLHLPAHAQCARSRCCRACARRPTTRSRASTRSAASATSSTASSSIPSVGVKTFNGDDRLRQEESRQARATARRAMAPPRICASRC